MVDTAKWEWREAAPPTPASPLDYTAPLRSTRAQNGGGPGSAAATQNYKLSCELSKESLRIPGAVPFLWERMPGIPAQPKPTLAALFKLQSPAPSVCNAPVSASTTAAAAGSVIVDDVNDDAASSCSSRATSDAITATAGALSTFDDSHSFACSAATTQIPQAAQDAKDSIMYRFLPAAQAIAGDSPAAGNGPPRRVPQNLPNVNPPSPAQPPPPQQMPQRRPISIQHISVLGSDDDFDDLSSDHNPPSSARSCSSSLLSFIRIRNAFHLPASGNNRRGNAGSGGAADLRSGNNGQHQLRRSSSRGSSASTKIGGFMSSPRKITSISCKGLCSDSSDDVCITAISSPLPPPTRVKDVLNDGVVFQHPPKPLIQSLDISDTSSCCSAYDTPTTFCNSPAAPPYSCASVKSAYSSASAAGGVGAASETASPAPDPNMRDHRPDSINNILANNHPQLSPNQCQLSPNHSQSSPNQSQSSDNHNIINDPVIMNINELTLSKPLQISIKRTALGSPNNNNNNNFIWSRMNGISTATSPMSTASINSANSNGRGAATEVIYCSDLHQSSINGHHLAAPPLPKSPTQSWLHGRAAANTINMGAVRSPSRFSQMHRAASGAPSPLAIIKPPMVISQSPSHPPPAAVSASEQILQQIQMQQQQQHEERLDSTWEALVKESHGSQPGHLRFSEELQHQHQESIPTIKISV